MRPKRALFVFIVVIPFFFAFGDSGKRVLPIHHEGSGNPKTHDSYIPVEDKGEERVMGLPKGWDGIGISNIEQVSDSTITEYMNSLVDFQTRFSCTDSNRTASQWIYDKFLEFGFTDVTFDSFPMNHTMYPCEWQWNVVAVKQGTIDPDKYVIVGGHFDSVTYFSICEPDSFAPGADDNASGTVATMEAARVLANEETDLSVVFIAFGAEEAYLPQDLWMIGSEHYAEEAYNSGMDIRVMVNLDVVGYLPGSSMDVRISESREPEDYSEIFADMAETYTDLIPRIVVGEPGSDELPFRNRGYSTIFLAEWIYSPYWHSCADTMEYVDIEYMTNITEMLSRSTLYLSNMPETPSGFDVVGEGDSSSIFVSWNPNTESDLSGYNIYYGFQSGIYDSLQVSSPASVGDTIQNLVMGDTVYVALSAFDDGGYESFLTEEESIIVGGDLVGLEGERIVKVPFTYALSQNYPNPFNPMTTIGFEVPRNSSGEVEVTLRVYDLRGRLVRTLIEEPREHGTYQVSWDGRDEHGSKAASGIYLYTIRAGDFTSTRKMTLLK
jgi:hypothetical protein